LSEDAKHTILKKSYLTSICLLVVWAWLGATGDSTNYLLPTDTLVLKADFDDMLLHRHRLEPHQTLFSLAKFYGLHIEELYSYNPASRMGYNVGDVIDIPIPKEAIQYELPVDYRTHPYALVYYEVMGKETVFSICKRKFTLDIETFCRRNEIVDYALRRGQRLFVGWISTRGVDPELQKSTGGYYVRLNHPWKLRWLEKANRARITEQKGKAAWTKDGDRRNFYALHRTAPVGSVVEIENPMTRITIYATVIGRIPDQLYDSTVIVVVSPLVITALRARDRTFYVRLRHL
jgi:hypothetical protein